MANIDGDCQRWLQGGASNNFAEYVNQIRTLTGHGQIHTSAKDAYVNAVTSPKDAQGFVIVINDDRAFFRGGAYFDNKCQEFTTNNGRIAGGTFAAKVFILLHECAHSNDVPGFGSNANDPAAVKRNNDRVSTNCDRTLRAAKRL